MAEALDIGQHGVDVLVVGAVDEDVAVGEELEFLCDLLATGEEVLVVCLADIGKDADGGVDDVAEGGHLAGLGDASLEDGEIVLGSHLPDGEGDADLGVVALGAGDDATVRCEKLDEPVFDDSLAVAAGDADDGNVELAAMVGGKLLEGGDNVIDLPEVDVVVGDGASCRDDKGTDPGSVEVFDVAATGVALGGNGEEKGIGRVDEAAAVSEKLRDRGRGVGQPVAGTFDHGSYFLSFHQCFNK